MRVRIIIYPQAFSNNYYLFKGEDRFSGVREKEPLGTAGRSLWTSSLRSSLGSCAERGHPRAAEGMPAQRKHS